MRRSPIKRTPEKSLSRTKLPSSTPSLPNVLSSSVYYCHYKNAMYMGGIKSFKKDGRGILLHDAGVSVISAYSNDLLHGHNIFFGTDSLVSTYFTKNKLSEAVYRMEGFLLFLNYNIERELEGKALLINYIGKSIVRAVFKKGTMVDRSQQGDFNLLNRVFDLGELDFLIGRTHANVMRYEFEKLPNIAHQKQGNKIIVGFQKNGFINGLGFAFLFRGQNGGYNVDTHRNEDEFQLRVVERGYYINTQLNGMGEKMFKNKNFYVGEFKNGIFEGNGVLKNHEKRNWVSGYFHDGNLVQLLEYNSQGENKQYGRIIEALHERKTNWINNEVQLIDFSFMPDEVEKMMNTVPNRQLRSLQQRKQEVLKRIQEKFISDTNTSTFEQEISGQSLSQLKKSAQGASVKKFITSFTPADQNTQKGVGISDEDREIISFQGNLFNQSKRSEKDNTISDRLDSSKSQERGGNRLYLSPSPQPPSRSTAKKIVHSPGWVQNRQNSSREEERALNNLPRSDVKEPFWQNRDQFNNSSRYSRRGVDSSGVNLGQSNLFSNDNKNPLDSKRMVNKNKIFKYLEAQDQRASPQFAYSKVDSLKENQSRRRALIRPEN